jgi:hypothetical protein
VLELTEEEEEEDEGGGGGGGGGGGKEEEEDFFRYNLYSSHETEIERCRFCPTHPIVKYISNLYDIKLLGFNLYNLIWNIHRYDAYVTRNVVA